MTALMVLLAAAITQPTAVRLAFIHAMLASGLICLTALLWRLVHG